MFIQTQDTPNPNSMKFLPGRELISGTPRSINNIENATFSPFAKELLNVDGVEAVYLANDFITVTKKEDTEWEFLKTEILTIIMDYIINNKPIILENKKSSENNILENDDEIVKQIKAIINDYIRPNVAMDGGDILFHSFEDGIVKVELQGACAGCPSSIITLKNGIENMIKHYIPEVVAVESV